MRDPEEVAWHVIANIQHYHTGVFDPIQIRGIITSLKQEGLLIGSTTQEDDDRLEEIRARDIQKRVEEDKGIMQGRREMMNVAFLLDYIDKLQRREDH